MSDANKRDRFQTRLACPGCGAVGHAVWEENSVMSTAGPMGRLVSLPENFVLQPARNHHGQPVIVCKACGTVQPD